MNARMMMMFVAGVWLPFFSFFHQISRPKVDSPQSGEAIQGVVEIRGTTDVSGFQAAEVAFAYAQDAAETWFLVDQRAEPVREGVLALWDTTSIADGTYMLRVRVMTEDGQAVDTVVKELRVRNYTPVETSTPASFAASAMPVVAAATEQPSTPTALPLNPAAVTSGKLVLSMAEGVAFVLAGFLAVGVYRAVQSGRNRR